MSNRRRRVLRFGFLALAGLLLAAWAIPSLFHVESYRRSLEQGLESQLGRGVEFGGLSLHLLPHPGFLLENVVVYDAPTFGVEPLARIDAVVADVTWATLLTKHPDVVALHLKNPVIHIVRNAAGAWNVASLMHDAGWTQQGAGSARGRGSAPPLQVDADQAHLSFAVAQVQKPFAVTGLDAGITYDPRTGRLSFSARGSPVRTDLTTPPPGIVEVQGWWQPGSNMKGPLDVTVVTHNSLLTGWAPVLTGAKPEVFALIDASLHLTGKLPLITIHGQANFDQLHRWEKVPPRGSLPVTVQISAQFNTRRGDLQLQNLGVRFGDVALELSGQIESLTSRPSLALSLALKPSRLEDFMALSARLDGASALPTVQGTTAGTITCSGSWPDLNWQGAIRISNLSVPTRSGTMVARQAALRFDGASAILPPTPVLLAKGLPVTAQGEFSLTPRFVATQPQTQRRQRPGPAKISRSAKESASLQPFDYNLHLSASAIPLHQLLLFLRPWMGTATQQLDARGTATGAFDLAGSISNPMRPAFSGYADLNSAALLAPGLTTPLHFQLARIQVQDGRVVATPVVATLGATVFIGRIEHQGPRQNPWRFEIRTPHLSLEEAAQWFDVLGTARADNLLARIPGLRTWAERRAAGHYVWGALNAQGTIQADLITYSALRMEKLSSSVQISGRNVHLRNLTFLAGGGRGSGSVTAVLEEAPPQLAGHVQLTDLNVASISALLPKGYNGIRGTAEAEIRFRASGLARSEMLQSLFADSTVRILGLRFGDFDALERVASVSGWGRMEPQRADPRTGPVVLRLHAEKQQVTLLPATFRVSGAVVSLQGKYPIGAKVELVIHADLQNSNRRWMSAYLHPSQARVANIYVSAPLRDLLTTPQVRVAQGSQP